MLPTTKKGSPKPPTEYKNDPIAGHVKIKGEKFYSLMYCYVMYPKYIPIVYPSPKPVSVQDIIWATLVG